MIVETSKADGKQIEIHEDRFTARPYWVKIDGRGLFQRGRMRIRAFATVDAARKAALAKVRQT